MIALPGVDVTLASSHATMASAQWLLDETVLVQAPVRPAPPPTSAVAPPAAGSTSAGWYYDVDKVGGSFGLFYGYVGIVGLVLYFVLRWFKAGVSLASVWCVYGECGRGEVARRGSGCASTLRRMGATIAWRHMAALIATCAGSQYGWRQPWPQVVLPPLACLQPCPRLRAGGLHSHLPGLHRASGERALGGGRRCHADVGHLHHAVAASAHPRGRGS